MLHPVTFPHHLIPLTFSGRSRRNRTASIQSKTGSRFDFTISISRGRLSDAKILASHEMGADIPPDFDAAVARFRAFLKLNSYSGNIVWVTPEDVLLTGKRFLYLRVPISADNETQMRRMYKQGVTQGRGLVMGTVCGMNRSTYCYLWFPKSVEEIPQGIWPTAGSLKLSATDKSSSRDGRPINNKMLWALLKLWHRKKQGLRDLLFSEKGLIVEVRQ
jgi:hypothetical protein